MYLKRLTCQGFKSFADRLDFDFKPGITGIVGPNGCGKSNIVDAIKWVLGDQSAKSLRGDQMQDVIFFGSGTRRNANFAQVDLVFDNEDRTLSVDAPEVRITRRLYRSGDSEYLINNERVRLKDIKELLMDTGVGVNAYSIIEQGKVSYLIQANPQDRRAVFEEAAGISRYKARKKEAERKLERVEQNLLRIEDIVEELEKRLRSVKYQAGKARNWQLYDQQLREKRATYSLAEFHRLSERLATLKRETSELSDEATRLRTAISAAETRESDLRGRMDALDAKRQQLQQRILTTTAEITEKRERVDQSQQQIRTFQSVRGREQQRLAAERQKLFRLQQETGQTEAELADVSGKVERAHAAEDELAGQDRALAGQLAALEARHEDEKGGILEVLRRTAQVHNEIQTLERERQQLAHEKQRLLQRQEQMRLEVEQLNGSLAEQTRRAEELSEELARLTRELEEKQHCVERLDADQAERSRQLAAAKEQRSGLMSRKQTLLDLEHKLEGVEAGIREVLHQREQDASGGTFGYVRGMVADVIAVDVAHAPWIEAALGESDQYVLVDDSAALAADAARLAQMPGRVPVICLDRLPPFVDGRDFSGQAGYVARASDLVRCDALVAPLVRHLLGRTIVVESFADALRMAADNPPNYRYVTRTGEVLGVDGFWQLGRAAGRTGLISRKSELAEIDGQIGGLDARIEELTEALERASDEMAALQACLQELRHARYEARAAEAENQAAQSATRNAIERIARVQPEVAGDIEAIDTRVAESVQAEAVAKESLESMEADSDARHARVAEIQAEIARMKEQRDELAERLTQQKVTAAKLGQQRSMLAYRLRGLQAERQSGEDAVRAAAGEVEQAAGRIAQAERVVLGARSRLAVLYADKQKLDADVLGGGRERQQLAVELEELTGSVKTHRTQLEGVEERLNARQIELHECRVRREELTTHTHKELGIDLAEAYANYEHEERDWAAIEAEIDELMDKIRRLGNVNLDAIDEQTELEERSSFLGSQRDDLRSSKGQLEELIEQLNIQCRERFAETFEAVRGNFNDMFRKLFGGGRAELVLETGAEGQEVDVLEAGIEIIARPPGKEMRTNSLLSGGEKTMVAIALLMAIFKSRPSPFTLLDEVDAALDESNNERFNRIIQEFLDRTQFVIITHQKPTMSIADVLYGITMQEAGVSRCVSVKFGKEYEPADAAVA
jgi:chromosome segregation protein